MKKLFKILLIVVIISLNINKNNLTVRANATENFDKYYGLYQKRDEIFIEGNFDYIFEDEEIASEMLSVLIYQNFIKNEEVNYLTKIFPKGDKVLNPREDFHYSTIQRLYLIYEDENINYFKSFIDYPSENFPNNVHQFTEQNLDVFNEEKFIGSLHKIDNDVYIYFINENELLNIFYVDVTEPFLTIEHAEKVATEEDIEKAIEIWYKNFE